MVKVGLRHYEVLAMCADVASWSPTFTIDLDGGPLPEFTIPRLKSFVEGDQDEESASHIRELEAQAKQNPEALAT